MIYVWQKLQLHFCFWIIDTHWYLRTGYLPVVNPYCTLLKAFYDMYIKPWFSSFTPGSSSLAKAATSIRLSSLQLQLYCTYVWFDKKSALFFRKEGPIRLNFSFIKETFMGKPLLGCQYNLIFLKLQLGNPTPLNYHSVIKMF